MAIGSVRGHHVVGRRLSGRRLPNQPMVGNAKGQVLGLAAKLVRSTHRQFDIEEERLSPSDQRNPPPEELHNFRANS